MVRKNKQKGIKNHRTRRTGDTGLFFFDRPVGYKGNIKKNVLKVG
jgi:hypothetical protein